MSGRSVCSERLLVYSGLVCYRLRHCRALFSGSSALQAARREPRHHHARCRTATCRHLPPQIFSSPSSAPRSVIRAASTTALRHSESAASAHHVLPPPHPGRGFSCYRRIERMVAGSQDGLPFRSSGLPASGFRLPDGAGRQVNQTKPRRCVLKCSTSRIIHAALLTLGRRRDHTKGRGSKPGNMLL